MMGAPRLLRECMTQMAAIRHAMIGVTAAVVALSACTPVPEKGPRFENASIPSREKKSDEREKGATKMFAVAPPPFSEDIFPCSTCHDKADQVNRTPRTIEFHEHIVLKHDEKNRWCLDCHSAQYRDFLHLADGRLVPFTESYRLCGQCHGPTLRNWKAGEHGKRTGSWNGEKQYLLCPSCHNPHAPKFKPIEPKRPPLRQEAIR